MSVPSLIGSTEPLEVSVGMCAHNEERHVYEALESLLSQELSEPFVLREVFVVASGCTDRTEDIVQQWSRRDRRIILLREASRSGKARALNLVLNHAKGNIIVSLNADARLEPGALASLLAPFSRNEEVVIACGAPVVLDGVGRAALPFVDLQWRLHNRTLQTLSGLGLPNHCCDEFMALRRGFVNSFPEDLMNDGAYLGTLASLRGISVVFCPDARVMVDPPTSVQGYIVRRQALLRGHQQIKQILQSPSNTLSALLARNPALACKILVQELFSDFRSAIAGILLLFPLELFATLVAFADRLRRRKYDPLWRMVD